MALPDIGFLADLNISPQTVEDLRQQGWNITRADSYLPANAPDHQILELARQRGLVVVTQDLDFSTLVALSGMIRPSLVTLRLARSSPKTVANRLLDEVPGLEAQLREGYAVTIQDSAVRLRKLPMP